MVFFFFFIFKIWLILLMCFDMMCLLNWLFNGIVCFKLILVFMFKVLSFEWFSFLGMMLVVNFFWLNLEMVSYKLFVEMEFLSFMFFKIKEVWMLILKDFFFFCSWFIFFIFLIIFVNIKEVYFLMKYFFLDSLFEVFLGDSFDWVVWFYVF